MKLNNNNKDKIYISQEFRKYVISELLFFGIMLFFFYLVLYFNTNIKITISLTLYFLFIFMVIFLTNVKLQFKIILLNNRVKNIENLLSLINIKSFKLKNK